MIPDQHRTEWPDATRPIRDPSDYDAAVAAFGRTYRTHDDPLAIVDLYQAVLEYRGEHPDIKSAAVSSALEVPRSTIRRWVDEDAVPYVVQGIQRVEQRGWLPVEDEAALATWARLVAWVSASGAINADRWGVQFVVDSDADRERLEPLLADIGCRTTEPDEPGTGLNGTVLGPTPDGSILGRVLAVLGAPVGNEKQARSHQLPLWLGDASPAVRRAFARSYVQNRNRRDGPYGGLSERRTDGFREALVALLRDVTGESVTLSGETDLYVSEAAMQALGLPE